MDKDNLYTSLYILITKLEAIKGSPMQDETTIMALTEILRYFRDNGELKKAFKYQKTLIQNIENQSFYKSMMNLFCSKINLEHPDVSPINIEKIMEEQFSDEFIENKIKRILE